MDRKLHWLGSSLKAVREFPDAARKDAGFALYAVQQGDKPVIAKPLKGFGGAQMQELVISDDGEAYRVVYTVRFRAAVYVLHAFHKKSVRGR